MVSYRKLIFFSLEMYCGFKLTQRAELCSISVHSNTCILNWCQEAHLHAHVQADTPQCSKCGNTCEITQCCSKL